MKYTATVKLISRKKLQCIGKKEKKNTIKIQSALNKTHNRNLKT